MKQKIQFESALFSNCLAERMVTDTDNETMKLLTDGAAALGIQLDKQAVQSFDRYMTELLDYNTRVNLTAITQPNEIVVKHFIDSMTLAAYADIPKDAALIDVGSGAGFPGIPLKLVRPDLRLTCIDSLNKRILFLQRISELLALKNTICLHLRAEEACRKQELRAHYDIATARAVAKLSVLAEICMPLLKTGGIFCAMKGPDIAEEVKESEHAVKVLGGEVLKVCEFSLPGTDQRRSIVMIKKIHATLPLYPRQTAQISKKPL